eukprot:4253408-Prorocentrum_lima.AAC.1
MDTGCRRAVAGPRWHQDMQQSCERNGLEPQRRNVTESFIFGDGDTVLAHEARIYPVGIGKSSGQLD